MADSIESMVQEHWGETNEKKYRRGSRLPKKTDTVSDRLSHSTSSR